ncbi:MAG: TerB family tellurite resistance protein [Leptospiraceae bacterium]|nr:TerB family tellurite resistance protein [Leptospiraceae bacterium]
MRKENTMDILKIFFAFAWIDHTITKEESAILAEIKSWFELSDLEKQIIIEWEQSPIPLNELLLIDYNNFSSEQKELVIYLLEYLAKSDSKITTEEIIVIRMIKEKMELLDLKMETIAENIKRSIKLYTGLSSI